jgi:hypothetical protein
MSLLKMFARHKNVTNTFWLKHRKRLNLAVSRRINKFRSDQLKKMSIELMNKILNSQKNLMQNYSWFVQVEHFNLNIVFCTLRTSFNQRYSQVSQFKKTRITLFNNKNKQLRVEYVKKYKTHTIYNFWQYVHFTNKIYFDLNQMFKKRTFCEINIKYNKKNLQTMLIMKRTKLHVIVFISWYYKKLLQFYND